MVEKLREFNFALFRADVTDASADHPAYAYMKELGHTSLSLPFLAIIPASTPQQPIRIVPPVTKEQFLKLIEEVGRSGMGR